jgi:hypothetical protein
LLGFVHGSSIGQRTFRLRAIRLESIQPRALGQDALGFALLLDPFGFGASRVGSLSPAIFLKTLILQTLRLRAIGSLSLEPLRLESLCVDAFGLALLRLLRLDPSGFDAIGLTLLRPLRLQSLRFEALGFFAIRVRFLDALFLHALRFGALRFAIGVELLRLRARRLRTLRCSLLDALLLEPRNLDLIRLQLLGALALCFELRCLVGLNTFVAEHRSVEQRGALFRL